MRGDVLELETRERRRRRRPGDAPPPHDLDAERAILGAILISNGVALDGLAFSADDFYRRAHARIFAAALDIHATQRPVDLLTLRARLSDRGELDDVGGAAYLASLVDGVPRSTNVPFYAERVHGLAAEREALAALDRAQTRLRDTPDFALGAAISEISAALTTDLSRLAETAGHSRLMNDVDVVAWPAPPSLVAGRIPANALVCLYAPPGIGKTFLSLDLSLCVATGTPWIGAPIEHAGPVVYVVAEGAGRFGIRVAGWKQHHGWPLDQVVGLHTLPVAVNLMDGESVAQLISDVKAVNPAAIVLDTFARCIVGADENSARDVGLAIDACDRVRRSTDATILLVHHTGKDGGAERGSSALRGAADTVMALSEEGDWLALKCEKQKDAAPFEEVRLELTPVDVVDKGASYVVQLAGARRRPPDLTTARQTALDALRRAYAATGAMTFTEWFAALPPRTVSMRRFYDVVDALETAGLVRHEGKTKRRWKPA